jgi:hypothetical protein
MDWHPMRCKVLLAAIILVFSILLIPTLDDGSTYSDGDQTTYYIEGYVVSTEPEGNIPLAGVVVTVIYNNITGTIYSDTTDSNGEFIVEVPYNTDLQIMFTLSGYTLRSCPNITEGTSGYYILDLTNITPVDNVYSITSDADGLQPAIMSQSSATVKGTISYSGGYVQGATITMVSTDGSIEYETKTNSKGVFTFEECESGTYKITITCGGFETYGPELITLSEGITEYNATLVSKENQQFFGMDLIHLMMFFGVLFGILISLIVFILVHHRKGMITIVDDTREDEK